MNVFAILLKETKPPPSDRLPTPDRRHRHGHAPEVCLTASSFVIYLSTHGDGRTDDIQKDSADTTSSAIHI